MEGNGSISNSKRRRELLLWKIKEFTRSLVKDLGEGRPPIILIDKFRNYCTSPGSKCCCSSDSPKGQEILTISRECHAHRIDALLRVLLIVQKLLQENKHGSKRDIYYMHPSVFSEQSIVDRAINDICILLQCSRHNLNVVAIARCNEKLKTAFFVAYNYVHNRFMTDARLVMGWLCFLEAGKKFDCINCPSTAHPIPVHVEEVRDIVSVAKYILIVEKESVFQRLANDRFCNTNRCIVITVSKTSHHRSFIVSLFLRLLVEKFYLPVYCLVDCDPYGFDILTTYRFGSMQMAYDAKFLRVTGVRWLGAFPSDIERCGLPQQCLLPLTAEDKRRVETMLQRCYLQRKVPQWRMELELMLQRGVKFEIEALSVQSISSLSDCSPEFLPFIMWSSFKIQPEIEWDSTPDVHHVALTCSFKVNANCDGCKRKLMELLQNLGGVYSVAIDTEQGVVKVSGRVNPVAILHIFDKYGKHGEVQSVRFDGEARGNQAYNFYGDNGYFAFPYGQYPPYSTFGGLGYEGYGINHALPPIPPPPPLGSGLMPPPTVHQVPSAPPAQRAAPPDPPAKPSAPEPPKKHSCGCTIM
ncbi:hypothetical protein Tsubulata_041619 [Turnera subulata]|uniref:DNA topoisomerase (ATP-hydrolyzing) n=1 Tax=Turnera subulata TaxID=218843 RepID=A0A9Q0JD58_9ROSI|nr:hypothetical protein Tsubulata_041619 [Turnera subulata]